jgi:isopentenyl-diphosphate delta-isomerase
MHPTQCWKKIMTSTELVILVDEQDHPLGTAEKLAAHREKLCHRAFSVFIFNPEKKLLLQQRAGHKYHSPLLWTNTCCSHPRPGEEVIAAGERRLREEMGIETSLKSRGFFHYIAHFDNGLTENEVDHVLVGHIDYEKINFNPDEVENYRWISVDDLKKELKAAPEKFTPWLEKALSLVMD